MVSTTSDVGLLAERVAQDWSSIKHSSSESTDVLYPLSHFVFDVAKYHKQLIEKNGKRVLNLSYGEPTKENGFILPKVLTEAVVEAAMAGDKNGYNH